MTPLYKSGTKAIVSFTTRDFIYFTYCSNTYLNKLHRTNNKYSKQGKETTVLEVEILGCSVRTPITVEMQADVGFQMQSLTVCATLKNTILLRLWISIKEQHKLFVQKPEHKPENTTLSLSRISTLNAPGTPSNKSKIIQAANSNKSAKVESQLHCEYS